VLQRIADASSPYNARLADSNRSLAIRRTKELPSKTWSEDFCGAITRYVRISPAAGAASLLSTPASDPWRPLSNATLA
jgi:hypothetical protein